MIRYQTERKVGFSRSRSISDQVKELIHGLLEADVQKRLTMSQALESAWLYGVVNPLTSGAPVGSGPPEDFVVPQSSGSNGQPQYGHLEMRATSSSQTGEP